MLVYKVARKAVLFTIAYVKIRQINNRLCQKQ